MQDLMMKDNMDECLSVSKYINWNDAVILAKAEEFKEKASEEIGLIKMIYEFVRDEIRHSWDVQDKRATKPAAQSPCKSQTFKFKKTEIT